MTTPPTPAVWPADTTLERDGIRLEPLALAHEAGVAAAAADGELWNIRFTSVPEPQETCAYIETALKQRAEGIRLAFAVIDVASNKVIGSTSYHDIVPAIKRVEIGWTWYAKAYQRSKVNTLCKLMLMQHAFETLGCRVVGWRASHMNFASQRAIERLGAKRDGVLRHHAPIRDGKVRDTVMYSMLAGEWPAAKEKLQARLLAQATGTTSSHKKVELTQVTEEMVRPLLRLTPGAIGERMVATNAVSLAQAAYSANAVPHAIVVDDVPVGFIMLYDPTIDAALAAKHGEPADAVQLWRLMIDFQRQGRGYGEAAILEAVRYAATRPGVTQMRLSYVPMEGNASPFYRSLGFVETGEKDGDEIVMAQPLSALVARLNANG
jgi:RimJ/RimL family protein N-acetyltransferase